MKLVSIVIPSLNSPLIDRVARAALDQIGVPRTIEVIVVGRAETQPVPDLPSVRFIDTGTPVGPATARNIGVKHAHSTIICFLDADCVPHRYWLQHLLAAYDKGHPVVGGGVELVRGGYWALCDDLLTFWAQLPWTQAGARSALASCNLLLNRKLIEQYGGFNEQFLRPAGEDTDLSYRFRRAGHELYCEPQAIVRHEHRRRALRDGLRHLYMFGAAQSLLQTQHVDLLAQGIGRRLGVRLPVLLCLAAPLLAMKDAVQMWWRGATPRRFWFALPGMALLKTAWYIGLALAWRAERSHQQRAAT